MGKAYLLIILIVGLISCNQPSLKLSHTSNTMINQMIDTSDDTNNFYDNTETVTLPVVDLIIDGEISNPGKVDFSSLPLHSVIVKESLLDSTGSDEFIGAYRYDGYSLFDILNTIKIKKSNSKEFTPIIDLYVEIENDKGEKVVFSWGEIYYPNNLHRIIIASGVSLILPSKTKELWPLPAKSKIVAANDLITERNISHPVKITVRSFPGSFPVVKGTAPLYSTEFKLFDGNYNNGTIASVAGKENITYNTIFYGRGKGIHSTSPFTGLLLREVIQKYYPLNRKNLQKGVLCLVGKDGYRCAVSYSEMFNRNDQQEFLLVRTEPEEDGGLFRIFAACDFFSDRAIKAVSEIHLRF